MARIRYNGLRTTLGGSLTNSATSVTFGAALTHSGGTAVPTLGTGDYIPLSILTSTGSLSEVVYLTAYTSGATSGTITRGREGTTGVSHASGDAVVHSMLTADLPPRSVDDPNDASWGTASSYDVEFDTDGTSLPSGWSWVNQGTSTWEQAFGSGILRPEGGAGADGGHRAVVRALPVESTWTATAKIPSLTASTQYTLVGLCLRDSTSGKITTFVKRINTDAVTLVDWSAPGVYATEGNTETGQGSSTSYFRIKRTVAGYTFQFSRDGIAWRTLNADRAAYGGTYDQIGFFGSAPASASGIEHSIAWFRVR